jgi:ABC-type transport system involved in multi-copper enzyme maturation permease subunit
MTAHGTVHDLAYKRYEGRRTSSTWRFWVIVRQAFWGQFRSRAVKIFLIIGLIVLAITALVSILPLLGFGGGALQSEDMRKGFEADLGARMIAAQGLATFLLMLTGAAPSVSADLNAGAFQFYFARPISRGQYLFARVLGAASWPFVLAMLTALTLTGAYAALGQEPLAALEVFGRAIGPLLLRLLVLGSVAVGLSSLTRRRGLAQAMFGGIVVASFLVTQSIALATHKAWVVAFGVTGSVETLGAQALGHSDLTGAQAAIPAIASASWCVLFVALAWWRLSRAEVVRG